MISLYILHRYPLAIQVIGKLSDKNSDNLRSLVGRLVKRSFHATHHLSSGVFWMNQATFGECRWLFFIKQYIDQPQRDLRADPPQQLVLVGLEVDHRVELAAQDL